MKARTIACHMKRVQLLMDFEQWASYLSTPVVFKT